MTSALKRMKAVFILSVIGFFSAFTQLVFPLDRPHFSHNHGFYSAAFTVLISSDNPEAKIFYTMNGNTPDSLTGILYTAPLPIATTTVLRAAAFGPDTLKSPTATVTYLFLDSVNNQTDTPSGYPAQWGPYVEITGNAIGDYGMDPEITQDSEYAGLMDDALLSLPTLSIVTDSGNLFSHSTNPDSGGIYVYTGPADAGGSELGGDWERPASIEYFNSSDSIDFQINCGVRLHGGHSRRPEKSPKHSFRVIFRSEYGPAKLDYPLFGKDAASSFNTLILRAGFGNMWVHHSANERRRAQHIRDLWGKQAQLDMGHAASHGNYVHLFLNGMYWGIYNPNEPVDNDFAAAYLGGNKEEYDIIKDNGEVVDGDKNAWNAMMALANAGVSSDEKYMQIQGKNPDGSDNPAYPAYVDMTNFIDYMLLNFYGENWDWDHHNWVAVRNRVDPGKGFTFYSWDAEHILENYRANILSENNANCPSRLFQQLRQNALFRRLFADRAQLHLFNNGALTPEIGIKRWMKFADKIDTAVIAESARWGDYRRDVHPWREGGPFLLYTKEHWLTEQAYMVSTYFPQRTDTFITHLKVAGLYPAIAAPQFLINGKPITRRLISAGDTLTMQPAEGTTYYTLNGTDPLTLQNTLSPDAFQYSGPIILTQSTSIKARRFQSDQWSALSSQAFICLADFNGLKISEIHYHPLDEDTVNDGMFEFIEMKNTGVSPMDISGVQFVNGISYTFSPNTIMNPGEFVVLASNTDYFFQRYGFSPFGTFTGSLDNSGERIVIAAPSGDTLVSLVYDDKAPWPETADGGGYSIVPVDVNASGDPNDPPFWIASKTIHGSPGSDDGNTSAVDKRESTLPKEYTLSQNFPNPFNPTTLIRYSIPQASYITLRVYDLLGREIATLSEGILQPGDYTATFQGKGIASGMYLYRLKAANFVETKKFVLLK